MLSFFCCSVGIDGITKKRKWDHPRNIGIRPLPPGNTGDLDYLFRPALATPAPLPKNCYSGGVGWHIEHSFQLNDQELLSNHQIKVGHYINDDVFFIFFLKITIPSDQSERRIQECYSINAVQRNEMLYYILYIIG